MTDVRDLPPSAKFVYRILKDEGPCTQSELIEETKLHRDTVRFALRRLDEADVLSEAPVHDDARQSRYDVSCRN